MTLYPMILLVGVSKTLFGVFTFHFKAKRGNFLCYEQRKTLPVHLFRDSPLCHAKCDVSHWFT